MDVWHRKAVSPDLVFLASIFAAQLILGDVRDVSSCLSTTLVAINNLPRLVCFSLIAVSYRRVTELACTILVSHIKNLLDILHSAFRGSTYSLRPTKNLCFDSSLNLVPIETIQCYLRMAKLTIYRKSFMKRKNLGHQKKRKKQQIPIQI